MSSLQEWIAQNNDSPQWETKVLEYFKEKLKENDAENWVPSLNDVPLHYLKANSLVKFRCFVQDMFDPEFYMGTYEHVDAASKSKVLKFGKYKDVAERTSDTVRCQKDRPFTVYLSLENQHGYAGCSHACVVPSTSYTPNRHKRSFEDDHDMDSQPSKQKEHAAAPQGGSSIHSSGDCKRLETDSASGQTLACSSPMDLNFPLPGERGPACLVKVYEGWDTFKVSDMLEVYGILSVDPQISMMAEEKEALLLIDPMEGVETAEERRVHSPPASLVPRLHVLLTHRLQHNNPLLPPAARNDISSCKTSAVAYLSFSAH
ncbi:hypothetical protein JZ751_019793 [Albula glossodonta]|uniref:Mini-chromosome maintenance complex-binding protein n=1 Tax=Albula glossodonta TaxID=121402 RepID=A0A8T2NLD6_9TELE|nr:hypothetical protein JZ751_019793 [Albula glossodonta]